MAVEIATAYISLVPSAQGISRSLSRELGAPLDRAARDAGERAGRGFSVPFVAAVAVAGAGVVKLFSSAASAARESEKISKQTAQVILTTGGAANVSAAQVGDYAGRLGELTGVDDEVIQSGANMLLTFTQVRNELGAGNDIFDQATLAALDMSVALGTDMKGASLLVGKALNDPLKGLTALTRSGVSFTAQQREQVSAMVASGDVMGAQRIILAELQTQFGGTAAALATPWERFKVVLGNLQEQAGAALLPVLDRLVTFLADHLPGALAVAGRWLAMFRAQAAEVWAVVGPLVSQTVDWFRDRLPAAIGAVTAKGRELWAWAQPFIEWLRANWQPVVIGVAGAIGVHLVAAFLAWAAAAATAAAAQLAAIAPAVAVGAAVAALIGTVVWAWQTFDGFRAAVQAVAQFFTGTVGPWIADFAAEVVATFAELAGWVRDHWGQIREAITHVVNVVRAVIETFVGWLTAFWRAFGDEITAVARVVWDTVRLVVETALNVIRGVIETVLALINGDWGQAWDAIRGILTSVWDFMVGVVTAALTTVQALISAGLALVQGVWDQAWGAVTGTLTAVWEGFSTIISGAWGAARDVIVEIVDWAGSVLGTIWDPFEAATSRVWGALKSAIGSPLRVVGDLVGGFLTVVATIAGAVGLDSLAGTLRSASESAYGWGEFASGGVIDHQGLRGFATAGPTAIVGEGNARWPEWVIPTDPRYRDRAKMLYGQVGARLYAPGPRTGAPDEDPLAGGGLFGGTPNVLGAVIDVARDILAGAVDVAWPALEVGPGVGGIAPAGVNTVRAGVIDLLAGAAQQVVAAQPSLDTSGGYQALIDYLRGTGVPHTVTSTLRPGSVTRAGNVSRHALGLAADFAGPSLRNIFDAFVPVEAQLNELIYSGAPYSIKDGARVGRYAVSDHWDHVHAALAGGALFSRPTMFSGPIAEHGPEIVSPVDQLRRIVAGTGTGDGHGFNGTIHVYLGDRQITDIVRVEVDDRDRRKEMGDRAGTTRLYR